MSKTINEQLADEAAHEARVTYRRWLLSLSGEELQAELTSIRTAQKFAGADSEVLEERYTAALREWSQRRENEEILGV